MTWQLLSELAGALLLGFVVGAVVRNEVFVRRRAMGYVDLTSKPTEDWDWPSRESSQ